MLRYLGSANDGRKVYLNEKGEFLIERRIPDEIFGPTAEEIEQFIEEHPNADACPNCGYEYYITLIGGPQLAYEDNRCRVCHSNPGFPHKIQSSEGKANE